MTPSIFFALLPLVQTIEPIPLPAATLAPALGEAFTLPQPAYARQILLKSSAEVSLDELRARVAEAGVSAEVRRALAPVPAGAVDKVGLGRIVVLDGIQDREAALARLEQEPWVEWAQLNRGGRAIQGTPIVPNDPLVSLQWALDQPNDIDMDLPEAWALQGGFEVSPMTIAVVDTGLSQGAGWQDLNGLLVVDPIEVANGIDDDGNGFVDDVSGYDFVRDDGDPDDEQGHGNGVTGIFAASTHNGIDMSGISPGVEIMALKAFNETGDFPVDGPYAGVLSAAAALQYAVDNGAVLVNNSWGVFTGPEQVVADAVQYALDNGVHLICAAGNDGSTSFFPADLDGVVAVAAIDSQGERSDWGGGAASVTGPWVDLCAGGTEVVGYFLLPGSLFYLNGTSMAAPNATGVAAMVLNQAPDLSTDDLLSVLGESAVSVDSLNPGFAGQLGAGHVNALGALELVVQIDELGSALAGTTAPRLNAWGARQPGDLFTVSLSGAVPNAPAGIVFGATRIDLPLFGGVLVPALDAVVTAATDANGDLRLSSPLGAGLPAGTELFLQAGVVDLGAPAGVAFSGALRVAGL